MNFERDLLQQQKCLNFRAVTISSQADCRYLRFSPSQRQL
jgi:hypothetical protein